MVIVQCYLGKGSDAQFPNLLNMIIASGSKAASDKMGWNVLNSEELFARNITIYVFNFASLYGGRGQLFSLESLRIVAKKVVVRQRLLQETEVEGAPRVWGTMRSTSSSLLKSALTKFSPSATLTVKRKTVQSSTGTEKWWWFVLHDSEEALKSLEEKWETINLYTGWKLEFCFKPVIEAHDNEIKNNPTVSQQDDVTPNAPLTPSQHVF